MQKEYFPLSGVGVKFCSKSEKPIYIKPILIELAFLLLLPWLVGTETERAFYGFKTVLPYRVNYHFNLPYSEHFI